MQAVPSLRLPALILVTALSLVACDDGVEPLRAARIEIEAGDAQTGVVGTALTIQPAVRVFAADGQAVVRAKVTFRITAGGGSVVRTRVATDSRGVASPGVWTLGTRSGPNALSASVSGLPALTFNAVGSPGPPTGLTAQGSTTLRGTVGTAVGSPAVRVKDAHDNPVAGVAVGFAVTAGGGSVINTTVTTGADGVASAGVWTLGGVAGTQTVTASSAAIAGSSLVFTATADAGDANRLIIRVQPAATASSGEPLPTQPVIQVADSYGNAVARAGVVVSASTSTPLVLNQIATTDATGTATYTAFAIIGTVGSYTIRFSSPPLNPVDANPLTLGPGAAVRLAVATGIPSIVVSGTSFGAQPVIEVQDQAGNRVTGSSHSVTANVASGSGLLTGAVTVNAVQGRAAFNDLAYSGPGPFQLRFSAVGLQPVTTGPIAVEPNLSCSGPAALPLDFALGQSVRFRADVGITPRCLQFDVTRNREQQYLVMIENLPRVGAYESAMFPGTSTSADVVTLTVANGPPSVTAGARPRTEFKAQAPLPPGMSRGWDFGGGVIYEYSPPERPGGIPAPMLVRGGNRIAINSASTAPVVGDTVVVFLEGVPRLTIPPGSQRAVVRHISNELIIAEDVRLSTMARASGTYNTPLTAADMDSIAKAYAAHSRAQGDLLFNGRHNQATEVESPARIIAVHTLMPADNIWGYTYSSTNVFAWDFWVSTNGSAKGINQHVLRNAHNLFMHEIAHMRHWGLLERANRLDARGNRWLVEGFARFTERLPTAAYLLNQADPSRSGNATLGAYIEYNGARARDDVPTYLNTSSSMLNGYEASSYIFDYLADQVALAGGNWRAAINQFLVNAGVEADLDAAVNALMPGLSFQQLFTRARLALYLDDIGTAGLPAWTQYHQYNLRSSREPTNLAPVDPRNAWPRIQPDTPFGEARFISPGAAWGYLIDGLGATANSRVTFDFLTPTNAVLSITRIR